ncbi:MAG: OB-fold nucleic acid binding domain-containing protein [Candidatus Woesearchaeota archaeon]
MLQISYSQAIEKIKEKSKLSEDLIHSKINKKMEELHGLVSKEGAAHIIANELGIKLFESFTGKMQIKNLISGMRNVEITGKIIDVYQVNEFSTEKGKGKVGTFLLADETGITRVVCWHDNAALLETIKKDDVVTVTGGYVRQNRDRNEVHLNNNSMIKIEHGITIETRKPRLRSTIKDLQENQENVEIFGTIVNVFPLRYFDVCPECNKIVKDRGEGISCLTHGIVKPNTSFVLNLILDDGTSTTRASLWKNQTTNLLQKSEQEISKEKNNPSFFESIKDKLLGEQIKLIGRTKKNNVANTIEFSAQLVFKADPNEELKQLEITNAE